MSSEVDVAPAPFPLGRPIRMDVRLEVAWTISTDGTSHGGSAATEHRVHTRSASSVSTIVAHAPQSPFFATTVRVEYSSDRTYDESNGAGEAISPTFVGKPFVLVAGNNGVVTVGGADAGLEPSDAEAVLRDYAEVGRSHSLLAAATTMKVRIGDEVQFPDAFLRRVVDSHFEPTVFSTGRMKYTTETRLTRVKDRRAVFDAALRTPTPEAGSWTEPALELRGELVLGAPEAWPHSLRLKGVARRGFATMAGVQTHEGTLELEVNWSYE